MPSGNRVHVRYASSLKQGLEEFFKEFLKPKGYKKDSCVGNIMLVSRDKIQYEFHAYEEAPPKAKR